MEDEPPEGHAEAAGAAAEPSAEAAPLPPPLIDEWLSRSDHRDTVAATVPGEPTAVFAVARRLDLLDDFALRVLLWAWDAPPRLLDWYRGVKRERPSRAAVSFDALSGGERGVILLAEEASAASGRHEIVLGAAGRLWPPGPVSRELTPDQFRAADVPADVRAVVGLRAEPASEGRSRVVVEVRVAAVGRRARLPLRASWAAAGPVTGVVRRRALERLKHEFGG